MSSFVCSPKHFCSIKKGLKDLYTKDQYFARWSPFQELTDIDTFIDNLIWLNVVCVNFQYKHHNEGKLDTVIPLELDYAKKTVTPSFLTLHGLYNALKCVNYQIETEHVKGLYDLQVSETMPILETLLNKLAKKIVDELPDDKSNTWCIN